MEESGITSKRSSLDDFELMKEIGKGAYSKVYKARRRYKHLKVKNR